MPQPDIDNEPSFDFEELYNAYATDVLRVCYFYLNNRQQAEDVCQDVFVKLLTSSPVLEKGKEKAWLLKVALNRCKDIWRSSWVKRITLGSPSLELIPAPDEIGKIGEYDELLDAVNHLSSQHKEVVLLFYYQNYDFAEISEMLGIPEGTVASRLNRARNKLAHMLKGENENEKH